MGMPHAKLDCIHLSPLASQLIGYAIECSLPPKGWPCSPWPGMSIAVIVGNVAFSPSWEVPLTSGALVGFQGRGCADGVHPDLCHASSLKPLCFNNLKNVLHFSDNAGAYDPGIQEERRAEVTLQTATAPPPLDSYCGGLGSVNAKGSPTCRLVRDAGANDSMSFAFSSPTSTVFFRSAHARIGP